MIFKEKETPNVAEVANKQSSYTNTTGGTAAAEAMASQLHNNYRLQQMASEGYELSAKSIGGRRTPAVNNAPKDSSATSNDSPMKS